MAKAVFVERVKARPPSPRAHFPRRGLVQLGLTTEVAGGLADDFFEDFGEAEGVTVPHGARDMLQRMVSFG